MASARLLRRLSPRLKTPVNVHIAYFLAAFALDQAFRRIQFGAQWYRRRRCSSMCSVVLSLAAALPCRAKQVCRLTGPSTVRNSPLVTIVEFSNSSSRGS